MNNKIALFLTIAIIALTILLVRDQTATKQVTLRFSAYIDGVPLVLHHQSYPNPGGEGTFIIRELQLFISNIRLVGDTNTFIEPESYHLVRFDNDNNFHQIVLPNIDATEYQQIELAIGVDPQANSSITIAGDLDPNSRMAWSWDVGYKFLLLEGVLSQHQQQIPLVYHIGFDESYTRLTFPINATSDNDNTLLNFNLELSHLFGKESPIDMAEISTVKFDKDDVALIAKGFESLISLE
ncbi:hypothetical protein tinsulaeT_30770 [Thalassotalea insulae]|uniref:Copper-binding protein MbnP-like domain-containing protein n=1 Tax=Thalassotalea insulae TaxID=2056778 RepID=A0ABQ6GV21_9GAMM|nr:MbnP family protein [Thalassotalea insulae]GLX79737.1 hypothetical protein tinsulaeT_30770 [Thalassotalea insulae]